MDFARKTTKQVFLIIFIILFSAIFGIIAGWLYAVPPNSEKIEKDFLNWLLFYVSTIALPIGFVYYIITKNLNKKMAKKGFGGIALIEHLSDSEEMGYFLRRNADLLVSLDNGLVYRYQGFSTRKVGKEGTIIRCATRNESSLKVDFNMDNPLPIAKYQDLTTYRNLLAAKESATE